MNLFERVAARMFGKSTHSAPALAAGPAPGPAARVTQHAATMLLESAPHAISTPPRRAVAHAAITPAARPLPTGQLGKFALEDTPEMVAFVTGKAPCAANQLAKYRAELEHRGYVIEETPRDFPKGKKIRVGATTAQFDAMPQSTRNAFMANGGFIVVSNQAHQRAKNPIEVAMLRRRSFPVQPPAGPTWRQFMNYSKERVAEYATKTQHEESGHLARLQLFDAYCSLGPASWRYEGSPRPWKGTGEDLPARRLEFREKFKESLGHCSKFGPWNETPNDPAPPLNPTAPTADFFLNLPEASVTKLKHLLPAEVEGRIMRAYLKRAFELADDVTQVTLLPVWEHELNRFPEEWVWPPVGSGQNA